MTTAPPTTHLIVTCTSRKRFPVPSLAQMRQVQGATLAKRLENWIDRLAEAPAQTIDVGQLYCGGHWDVVRRLPNVAKIPLTVWVTSAGYGLIPAWAPVKPYAATFDARHPDTVIRAGTDAASWWRALAEWNGPTTTPRTIMQLASWSPDARLILVLSESIWAHAYPTCSRRSPRLPVQTS